MAGRVFWMARYFGAVSPKVMCNAVMSTKPRATETVEMTTGDCTCSSVKKRFQDACEVRLADPAQGEARQGHAQLRGGEIGIQVLPQVANHLGALVAVFDQGIKLRGAHLDQGKLGGDEEPVEQHQPHDGQQPAHDDGRRIPLPRDLGLHRQQRTGKNPVRRQERDADRVSVHVERVEIRASSGVTRPALPWEMDRTRGTASSPSPPAKRHVFVSFIAFRRSPCPGVPAR